jgi:SlyX protein
MDQQDLDRRLEKIETKLAFLEDFITRLHNETVARNALLEKLSDENSAIKARLLQISGELEEIPSRRPPHY